MKNNSATERRAQIMDAALDLFAEKGYHATKIGDITGRLSLAHGTFYIYFKSKLEIFAAVVDRIIHGITGVILAEGTDTTNTLTEFAQQMSRLGNGLFAVFLEDARIARVMFYQTLGVDRQVDEKIDRVIEVFDQYTHLYLANGVTKGFLKADLDTRTTGKAINGMIFAGIKDLMTTKNPRRDKQRWIDVIKLLVLSGAAAEDAAPMAAAG